MHIRNARTTSPNGTIQSYRYLQRRCTPISQIGHPLPFSPAKASVSRSSFSVSDFEYFILLILRLNIPCMYHRLYPELSFPNLIDMSSNTIQYETLAEQIEPILRDPEGATAQVTDEGTRHRLLKAERKLAASLEQPRKTSRRIGYSAGRTADS